MRAISKNYIFNAFFWSILSKILNAVFGFVSVPLLLGYFGKANYGILSIATACNGCMHLMDLGVNTGAIKFFSQWAAEGKRDLIQRVSNTNTTFYLIIALINILGLLFLACFGESFFSVSHDEFINLRCCFYILAFFSVITWVSSAYTQLLTAYKKIAFTMKVNCVTVLLRIILLIALFTIGMSLTEYFFFWTATLALGIIPYIIKCKHDGLLDSLKPAVHWKDFALVFSFSLSIFALSSFQVLSDQSRSIILSLFALNGADAVAEYRIIAVFPQFIIMLCGSLIPIFLPNASEMLVKSTQDDVQNFVNKWTTRATIFVCVLCFPFIIASNDILSAYVGTEYVHLSKWLQLWSLFLIIQMHCTPAYSFVLAKGKTKVLVIATAIATVISMAINIFFCKSIPVGSAIIGQAVNTSLLAGVNYIFIYKNYVNLKRLSLFRSFLFPMVLGTMACMISYYIPLPNIEIFNNARIYFMLMFGLKAFLWFVLYAFLLLALRVIKISEIREMLNRRG